MLRYVGIRVIVLADFLAKISNRVFHCPWGVASQQANTRDLGTNMAEKVDTLSNKMDTVWLSLIIKLFKLMLELVKKVHPCQELII